MLQLRARRRARNLTGGWASCLRLSAASSRGGRMRRLTRRWRGAYRASGRRGAYDARSGGQSGSLALGCERKIRNIERRRLRGTRQRRLNGRVIRPRTRCAPGVYRAGNARRTPCRTRRRKANHQSTGRNISCPPTFGRSRPIHHMSCTHTTPYWQPLHIIHPAPKYLSSSICSMP